MRSRLAGALLLLAVPAAGQDAVRVGVDPAVVTVGAHFRLVVESLADRGVSMELRVVPDPDGTFEAVGRGADPATGLAWVEMIAWRTGPPTTLTGELRIAGGGQIRSLPVQLATPLVRSVLPPDSGRIPPKPPRDVIGPDREPLWSVIAAAGLAGAALAAWLLRRRRRFTARPPHPGDARADALAALDRIRSQGLLERGELRPFYEATADAVRAFAAAWSLEWSRDLTSEELLDRLRRDAAPAASALAEVLAAADQAKFAARPGDAARALREWKIARAWVAEQTGGDR